MDQALHIMGFPVPHPTSEEDSAQPASDSDSNSNSDFDSDDSSSSDVEMSEAPPAIPMLLPYHLELSQPVVRLPSNIMQTVANEILLNPTEDDTSELDAEWEDEEKVDKHDRKVCRAHEQELRKEFHFPVPPPQAENTARST